MVFTSRPFHQRDEYARLVENSNVQVLSLKPLIAEDFCHLVQQCLGTDNISSAVINLIRDKSDGNPLIARELSYSLLNKGHLIFRNTRLPLSSSNSNRDEIETVCMFDHDVDLVCPVPNTVYGIITARLDRLLKEDPRLVLLLKTAAIIQIHQQSQVFNFGMLMDCYPVDVREHTYGLAAAVSKLESQRLISRVNHQDDGLEILDLSLISASVSTEDYAHDMDKEMASLFKSAKSRAALRERLRRVAFRFSHGFTGDVLRQTVTDAQLKLLISRADTATELQEERIRLRWLEATVGKRQAVVLSTHLAGAWCDVLKDTERHSRPALVYEVEPTRNGNSSLSQHKISDSKKTQLMRTSSAPGELLRTLGSRWKRRWVVLDTSSNDNSGQLLLYRSPDDCSKDPAKSTLNKPPLQRIHLRGAEVLTRPSVHTSRDCFEVRCQMWTKDGKLMNQPRAFYFGAKPKGLGTSSGSNTISSKLAAPQRQEIQDSHQWVFMIKLAIQKTQLEDLRAKHRALDPDLVAGVSMDSARSTDSKSIPIKTVDTKVERASMTSNPMHNSKSRANKKLSTLSEDTQLLQGSLDKGQGLSTVANRDTPIVDTSISTEKLLDAAEADQNMKDTIAACKDLAAKLSETITSMQIVDSLNEGSFNASATSKKNDASQSIASISAKLSAAVINLENCYQTVSRSTGLAVSLPSKNNKHRLHTDTDPPHISISEKKIPKTPSLQSLLSTSNLILDQSSKSFILDYMRDEEVYINTNDSIDLKEDRQSDNFARESYDSYLAEKSSAYDHLGIGSASCSYRNDPKFEISLKEGHIRGSAGEIVWGYNPKFAESSAKNTKRKDVNANSLMAVEVFGVRKTSMRLNAELSMWGFDVLAFGDESVSSSGTHVGKKHLDILNTAVLTMFRGFDILTTYSIPIEVFSSFVSEISICYHMSNPYHNYFHAVDVMQTVYCIIASMDARNMLRHADIFAIMVAALAHDVDHPGTNNSFHVNARTELALR